MHRRNPRKQCQENSSGSSREESPIRESSVPGVASHLGTQTHIIDPHSAFHSLLIGNRLLLHLTLKGFGFELLPAPALTIYSVYIHSQ